MLQELEGEALHLCTHWRNMYTHEPHRYLLVMYLTLSAGHHFMSCLWEGVNKNGSQQTGLVGDYRQWIYTLDTATSLELKQDICDLDVYVMSGSCACVKCNTTLQISQFAMVTWQCIHTSTYLGTCLTQWDMANYFIASANTLPCHSMVYCTDREGGHIRNRCWQICSCSRSLVVTYPLLQTGEWNTIIVEKLAAHLDIKQTQHMHVHIRTITHTHTHN